MKLYEERKKRKCTEKNGESGWKIIWNCIIIFTNTKKRKKHSILIDKIQNSDYYVNWKKNVFTC